MLRTIRGSVAPETDVPTPSQAAVDAALLEIWSDDRWEKWVDEQVEDRVRVRELIRAQFLERPTFTPSEDA